MFILDIIDEVDSTNRYLKDKISNVDSNINLDRYAVVAQKQTAGVGKLGAKWVGSEGNLFLSFIIKDSLSFSLLPNMNKMSLLCGLVMVQSVQYYLEKFNILADLKCKWPNDVLINNAKFCGILLELQQDKDGTDYLVAGVGANLKTSPEISIYPTISLYDIIGETIRVEDFTKVFLQKLSLYMNNFHKHDIISLWLNYAYKIKSSIRVKLSTKIIEGIFIGLDHNGFMLINDNDTVHSVSVGEVFFN